MKKNMLLCFILVLITMLILPIHTSAYDYGENDVIIDFLPGDIDGNQKLTSADARLCLRASANLETLTAEQIKTVDFDGTGEVNSSNARQILRASAKIETITVTVNLKIGQRIVAGPLKAPTGREWVYSLSKPNKFDIAVSTHSQSGDKIGAAPDKYVCLTAAETGSYNVVFQQQMGWSKELYKEFKIILNVS